MCRFRGVCSLRQRQNRVQLADLDPSPRLNLLIKSGTASSAKTANIGARGSWDQVMSLPGGSKRCSGALEGRPSSGCRCSAFGVERSWGGQCHTGRSSRGLDSLNSRSTGVRSEAALLWGAFRRKMSRGRVDMVGRPFRCRGRGGERRSGVARRGLAVGVESAFGERRPSARPGATLRL